MHAVNRLLMLLHAWLAASTPPLEVTFPTNCPLVVMHTYVMLGPDHRGRVYSSLGGLMTDHSCMHDEGHIPVRLPFSFGTINRPVDAPAATEVRVLEDCCETMLALEKINRPACMPSMVGTEGLVRVLPNHTCMHAWPRWFVSCIG